MALGVALAAAGCAAPGGRLATVVEGADFERLSEARLRCTAETAANLERTVADPYEIALAATDICAGHEQAMIRFSESRGFAPADYQPLIRCLRVFDFYDIGIGIAATRSDRPGYATSVAAAPDRRFPVKEPRCFTG
jgi:hypothetical protein